MRKPRASGRDQAPELAAAEAPTRDQLPALAHEVTTAPVAEAATELIRKPGAPALIAPSPEMPSSEVPTGDLAAVRASPEDETQTAAGSSPDADNTEPTAASSPDEDTEPTAASAPVTDPNAAPAPIGTAIKHYELIRKLGQGGMGSVYLARDTKLGRLVAIKVLLNQSEYMAKRFLAEARATARCKHENIIVIHEVDEVDNTPYMVLEFLEGLTLRAWMAQRRQAISTPGANGPAAQARAAREAAASLSPSLAIELMVPVVRALVCAHEHGIVHRDLKPDNILMTHEGTVKVLDFGIAKQLSSHELTELSGERTPATGDLALTGEGAIIGTLPYMSPEQLRGRAVDHRTDLWAVGIMFYELITGAHPCAPLSRQRLAEVRKLSVPMPSVLTKRSDLGALGGIIDRCLRKRAEERIGSAAELLAELESLLPGRQALILAEDESPFAGLAAFQEADSARFFGREQDVASMLSRLRQQELVAVAGPSGAGKSSFVRAGVIPALKRSGEHWDAWILRPGRNPLAALADVLLQVTEAAAPEKDEEDGGPRSHAELLATLHSQPGYLGTRLRRYCRRGGTRLRVLFFIDQFEELYTLCAEADERRAFIACLEGAADDASSPLRVIVAVRSDFLDRMAGDRQLMSAVTRGLMFLPPMGPAGLRDALLRPLTAAGHRFESDGMLEDMLQALAGARSPLPLLQFTAAKLWEMRDRKRRLLTQASYQELGGVAGALSTHADAVMDGLATAEARLARAVFLRLVTPEGTRAIVSMDELRELSSDGDAVSRVVERLADARLVLIESSTAGERTGTPDGLAVELVHESLIERWGKLRAWIDENEQDAKFLGRLRVAAKQWHDSGRPQGLLWRDSAAIEARDWLRRQQADSADGPGALSERERGYLLAVVALAARTRRWKARLLGGVIASLAAVAMVVSYLAVRADEQARRAQVEAMQARNATRMVAAREHEADAATVLALLRNLEPPLLPRGWSELASTALYSPVAEMVLTYSNDFLGKDLSPDGARVVGIAGNRLIVLAADGSGEPVVLAGHEDTIEAVEFSPDSTRIISASADGTVRVWRADGSGEPVVLRHDGAPVKRAMFTPDSTRIISLAGKGTVRVFRSDGSGQPAVLHDSQALVSHLQVSQDSTRVMVLVNDTMHIYRLDEAGGSAGAPVRFPVQPIVTSAHLSPDGSRVVTTSLNDTIEVYSTNGTGEPVLLRAHDDVVLFALFSPDGQRIVSASRNNMVRVWNADGTGEAVVYGPMPVQSIDFSPDGSRILMASGNTARVWDVRTGVTLFVLRGHKEPLANAMFSKNGSRMITTAKDGSVRVYGREPLVTLLPGDPRDVLRELVVRRPRRLKRFPVAAFDMRGARLTASVGTMVQVWNADTSEELLTLGGHLNEVNAVAFSPDGARIVSASADGVAKVWKSDGSGEPVVLDHARGSIEWAGFSQNNTWIATLTRDSIVRVWKADGSGEPLVIRPAGDAIPDKQDKIDVLQAELSPDSKRIAIALANGTVQVWNIDGTGQSQALVLSGHTGDVWSASFSPDGARIVTASADSTAAVWRADGTGKSLVLSGHAGEVLSARFSPDGTRIVTASADGTAAVWRADGTGKPLVLRGHGKPVTWAEFSQDGSRVLTVSNDMTVRVWSADGTGDPLVLHHDAPILTAVFSPDSSRIATVSRDNTARLWKNTVPLSGPDARGLWTATAYCLPAERRVALLGEPESAASKGHEQCRQRVQTARNLRP